ncbi:hypothetical protein BC826DRAFT_980477 [Russula brevipes]|nr:hypothetical protein BC826DRAFT_980477 [Russula brevipes]
MPLRSHPKIFQVLVKTHKLTVFLALPNETAISVVKEQVLSAFLDDVFNGLRDVPKITGSGDFVLSRAIKERGRSAPSYEALTDDQLLRDVVNNWAVLFVQFKDASGRVKPVEEVPGTPSAGFDLAMDTDEIPEESSVRKGKRKAVD